MHLYPSQGRKNHRFPTLRDRVIQYIMVVYKGHTRLLCPLLEEINITLCIWNLLTLIKETLTHSHITCPRPSHITCPPHPLSTLDDGTPTTIQTCFPRDQDFGLECTRVCFLKVLVLVLRSKVSVLVLDVRISVLVLRVKVLVLSRPRPRPC